MSRDEKKNVPHSVLERLRNHAIANREDFNFVLLRYGMERFLYRLSVSAYADRFVLKGASMLLVWMGQSYRVTRDADLLALDKPDVGIIEEIFREIISMEGQNEDGIQFLADSIHVQSIRENQENGGLRVTLTGLLKEARISVQIDIGFGDAITPAYERVEYPTLLDGAAPWLNAYPRYTFVAEKFEAMVRLGTVNSRMKDFYDIWLISRTFEFNGNLLHQATTNTFIRRRTLLPDAIPVCFTPAFFDDPQKRTQWNAFIRNAKPAAPIPDLSIMISDISLFLVPVLNSLQTDVAITHNWFPELGWVAAGGA